ncbi:MAG: PAS domain S-box protein [Terriglobales bacterium]
MSEVVRLEALRSYGILDTPAEQAFDDLARLAAYICGTPIALIGFTDLARQWFKSRVGWDVPDVPREMWFSTHTIPKADVLVVSDTLEDPQEFATCPLATHGGIRFYAGASLISGEGYALGTLCVMDSVPRGLTEEQTDALRSLARQVMTHLESRRRSLSQIFSQAASTEMPDTNGANGVWRESEGFYCRVAETASDAIIVIDEDSKILFVNRSTERVFGYLGEELRGQHLTMLMPDYLRQIHQQAIKKYVQTGEKHFSWDGVELPGLHKSGKEIWLEICFSEFIRDGKRTFTGMCRDVTGRKRLESEQSRLAAIVESSYDAIIGKNLDGIITSWNKGAERIYGYSAEEVIGKPVAILFPADRPDELPRIMETVKSGEGSELYETIRVKKNGERIHISLTVSPIRDQAGRIVGASTVGRDVTEQRALEVQLRQAQKIEAVGQLAGGIAHEFNNFLGVVLGYNELLSEEARENERLRQYIAEIKAATQRAASLTHQLLAFSRKQVLEPQVLDLNQAIWETHQLLRRLVPANIDVVPLLAPIIGRVKVDPGQVQQILINLVVNARDAMPEGGKVVIETADVELDEEYASHLVGLRPGSYVLLSVSDTGQGMDAETLSHVFEPFFTTKEPGKGTGLGLSTTYGIAKQSGGHTTVESTFGKGTIFRIYLPRVQAIVEEVNVKPPSVTHPGENETILVVEDETALRRLLCASLERRGYKVLAAKDGAEAIEIFRQQRDQIHLVVSDIMMPHVDGFELKQRLVALHSDVKFVFMSGYSEEIMEKRQTFLQGCAFLEKPFLPDELAGKVRELLKAEAVA